MKLLKKSSKKKLIMVQIDSNKSAKTAETLLQLDCFTANILKNKNQKTNQVYQDPDFCFNEILVMNNI